MQVLQGKRVTVAGLGHFGGQIAAARWLVEQGAEVLVTDQLPADKLAGSIAQLDGLPIQFRLGEHRAEDFTGADLIVASPAIPPHSRFLSAARDAGKPITTEVRLFVERCPATIVGVTGTKGKSTTTALLGRMLETRFKTWTGGNIGKPLLLDLPYIAKPDIVVLELSSYMLDHLGAMHWSPHVAVVTMLAADHLEWHGGLDAYLRAKANIVRFQRPDDIAVLNEASDAAMALARQTPGRVIRFGVNARQHFELPLAGRHNQSNVQGAFAAANALGVSWNAAQTAVREFVGLRHRLQRVACINDVSYYNDSIATVPESAVAALESFAPHQVIQIIGGYEHGLATTELCHALASGAKAVLCIGKTGDMLAGRLSDEPERVPGGVHRCGDLATAVKVASHLAAAGDVVLLSPGYKSYDQFQSFEQRGDAFERLVLAINQGTVGV